MKKLVTIIILGVVGFFSWFLIEKPEPPFGAVVTAELDNKTVSFVYEDSKTDENLVLKLEANNYGNNTPIYFSIQNTTVADQTIAVVFTFKNNQTEVYDIKEFVKNAEITRYASDSLTILGTKTVTNWTDKVQVTPNKTLFENAIKIVSGIKDKMTVGSYYSGFASFIPAGETKFYKFRINANPLNIQVYNSKDVIPSPEISQEFYIEVFGDSAYGHIY